MNEGVSEPATKASKPNNNQSINSIKLIVDFVGVACLLGCPRKKIENLFGLFGAGRAGPNATLRKSTILHFSSLKRNCENWLNLLRPASFHPSFIKTFLNEWLDSIRGRKTNKLNQSFFIHWREWRLMSLVFLPSALFVGWNWIHIISFVGGYGLIANLLQFHPYSLSH